jgi:hypothetical protein
MPGTFATAQNATSGLTLNGEPGKCCLGPLHCELLQPWSSPHPPFSLVMESVLGAYTCPPSRKSLDTVWAGMCCYSRSETISLRDQSAPQLESKILLGVGGPASNLSILKLDVLSLTNWRLVRCHASTLNQLGPEFEPYALGWQWRRRLFPGLC